jgi:predicted Mrr-cat superfamily restriction endonuclease
MANDPQAFVLRIAPSGVDRVALALREDVAIIGWAAPELLNPSLDWKAFREIVRARFYAKEDNLRRAGAAAGHMWRFIRDMKIGDLLVTPHGNGFFIGRIAGPAFHLPDKVKEDTAYRRKVDWLNNKQPVLRATARAALQSRAKIQGTSADASDLVSEIMECLGDATRQEHRTFDEDLKARLVKEALDEMRSGRLDSFKFEQLVRSVLLGLGAHEARIVPRAQDKGADILASFVVAGAFRLLVAVQVKHFQPEPPVGPEVVQQLIQGIEAEAANLGMVVTSGTISEDASAAADLYFDQKGIRIELIDGPQLAALIVERGLRAV